MAWPLGGGVPNTHSMYDPRRVGHLQCGRWHMHGSSQDDMVLFEVHSLCLLAFISVNILLSGGRIVCLLMHSLPCCAYCSLDY